MQTDSTLPSEPLRQLQTIPVPDGYQIRRWLDSGGEAVVYVAQRAGLETEVAFKLACSVDAHVRDRFLRGARAAATLQHPGVLPILDFGVVSGLAYVTTPLIERGSLKRWAPLEPRYAAQLLIRVSFAVQYAHERDIIHRDLKPANILLASDGEPLVADFGLARSTSPDASLTTPGVARGTPAFMAPDVARGAPASALSDIFSLGATLQALVTGAPPQEATPAAALPEEFAAIIRRATDPDPAGRYPTARAFSEALEEFRRRTASGLESGSVAPPSAPRP